MRRLLRNRLPPLATNSAVARALWSCAVLVFAALLCLTAYSQELQNRPSELARQNLQRVAASAMQLGDVLHNNPGIMVELKKWIARDATEHGRLISDADLIDQAIYDRLEVDVEFRAVATALVQKYGYLLPQLNPDSPQGREQALLIEARAKWQAQDEEERLKQAAQGKSDVRQTRSAAPGSPPENGDARLPPENPDPRLRPGDPASLQEPGLTPGAPPPGTDVASINFESLSATSPSDAGKGLGTILPISWDAGEPPAHPAVTTAVQQGRVRANALVFSEDPGESAMLRKPVPYVAVPSLYDMYIQATPRPPKPRRFGMQVFENGSRDSQVIPFDLPAGPDYVVGPGDGLTINLWGGVSQRFSRTVDREGRVSLPEAGPVLVAGKSLAEVQESVQSRLRSQFRDVSADISLSRLRTIRVYVVGDVKYPGAYDVSSLSTPLNALFLAGGPTPQGSLREVVHSRGDQVVQRVDLYDLLLHGVRNNVRRLENGDTVLVSPMGPQVTVDGMVRRPAIYELRGEKSLSDVLALAGGLLPTATLRHIEVQRVVAHEKRTMVSFEVTPDSDPAVLAKQLDSFQVQDSDSIRIFPIAPYNQDILYLEGHVLRPGRYSYRPGMRVTDLISSYQDLLPEPAAQYAEIIRLSPPDYRPVIEAFNLGEALSRPQDAPALQPLDTVQIFGRYDFENFPTVSVWGEVRSPGTYRTSGELRLSDAIHMAGGLSPEAEREDAQVFRYLPDGQLTVLSVKLGAALAGHAGENIVLNSRDRILVHRNAASVEPATVYIRGEVAQPGRYPLTANMTVADLLRSAGGPKQSADLQSADLTQYDLTAQSRLTGQHQDVPLAGVLGGAKSGSPLLHNGDVLSIRKLPGWDDLGASISVHGEVVHAGTYGIKPGERLSSILRRAGGFMPDAYPYGAVLIRPQVRELENQSQIELMDRVRDQQWTLKLASKNEQDPDAKLADEAAYRQWQDTLNRLTNSPPVGRITIQISSQINSWAGTPRDITVRAGDKLFVPKKPSYVMVQGQVFNPTAIGFRPGKNAKWYLNQAGGPTNLANKKAIFVIRADGTVIGRRGYSLFLGSALDASLQPGDVVIVPERALGGPPTWKALFQSIQVGTSIATSAILAARY